MTNWQWASYTFYWCALTYLFYLGWCALFDCVSAWRINRHKYAGKVDGSRLCTSHSMGHCWISIRWKDETVTEVKACSNCGYIPSKNAMVSRKALPSMGVWYREHQFLNHVKAEFIANEEAEVKRQAVELAKTMTPEAFETFYARAVGTKDRMEAVINQAHAKFHSLEKENQDAK